MFIEKEDLYTAICEYQLQSITTSAVTIRMAILAAIDEAKSYLNAKYDCEAIFSAKGDDRHATLLEHCKNIAVWNLCRRANTDLIFEQAKTHIRQVFLDLHDPLRGEILPVLLQIVFYVQDVFTA